MSHVAGIYFLGSLVCRNPDPSNSTLCTNPFFEPDSGVARDAADLVVWRDRVLAFGFSSPFYLRVFRMVPTNFSGCVPVYRAFYEHSEIVCCEKSNRLDQHSLLCSRGSSPGVLFAATGRGGGRRNFACRFPLQWNQSSRRWLSKLFTALAQPDS